MPSYSNDVSNAEVVSIDSACSVRDMAWGALVHNCKALYGSSGAPLLIRDGSGYAIVGIHTGSMFASDSNGHVAQFVGNRAIRSRKFTQTLQALSTRLKRTPLDPDGSP